MDIGITSFKKHLVDSDTLDTFEKLIFELEGLKEDQDIYN